MRCLFNLLLASAFVAQAQIPALKTGREVVEAMHAHWQGRWYRTLAFSQHTRFLAPDGTETLGVWHEALEHPGRLRIDFAPLAGKTGLVCTPDRIHHFKGGSQVSVQDSRNHLLVLIGDIYCQPVSRSLMQLAKLGFDPARTHRAQWRGRTCFVVGAEAGDERSNQFWIDAETFLLWRVIRKDPDAPKAMRREVRIEDYRHVQGYPIAAKIHFLDEGRLFFSEDYFDIRVNPRLDPALFDPSCFASVPMPLGSSPDGKP